MARHKVPVTQAVRALRAANITFTPHFYAYKPRGGTRVSSSALGVTEHNVVKTLVMETSEGDGLVVLMHGDHAVSTRSLARHLGVKSVSPCEPGRATQRSGYQVGGTSPFGLRNTLPIYAQTTIQALERLYINGGRRGFLVEITPTDLSDALELTWIECRA